jgi:hypothetical protein
MPTDKRMFINVAARNMIASYGAGSIERTSKYSMSLHE